MVRVEVSDASLMPPVLRRALPEELGGRGLAIVAALVTSWGFEQHDHGKTVWAELC